MDDFYTREQVAQILGIAVNTLMNRISGGKAHPPYFGRGKATRFPKDAFERWAKSQLIYEMKQAS